VRRRATTAAAVAASTVAAVAVVASRQALRQARRGAAVAAAHVVRVGHGVRGPLEVAPEGGLDPLLVEDPPPRQLAHLGGLAPVPGRHFRHQRHQLLVVAAAAVAASAVRGEPFAAGTAQRHGAVLSGAFHAEGRTTRRRSELFVEYTQVKNGAEQRGNEPKISQMTEFKTKKYARRTRKHPSLG